ncbi:MAG TPA: response regulator [Spirochaetota bacterium]|nr:response regulator [Spirochaetota bacterium]HPN81869.1 response regulator [Spirochaetota bacterium]
MAEKVLIVDDSAIMRNLVRQTLSSGGYEVVLANDGMQGLEAWRSSAGSVDLIITDINMPVMDGITLISEIRKMDEDVPILALTSESDVEMRNKGVDAGANGWIVKPFHGAQFLDIVRQILA